MNKLFPLLFAVVAFSFYSCEKEYSLENGTSVGSDLIVGIDCRISKIVYIDSSSNIGIGSIDAVINSLDDVSKITRFDSLSNTISNIITPVYTNDSIYINADEYFVYGSNKRIIKMHGLVDPTDPFSIQFDVFYLYDAAGHLIIKDYFLTSNPINPYKRVTYSYADGNLSHMSAVDLLSGDMEADADMTYYSSIIPQKSMYIFPDEVPYADLNQFFNFGLRNFNAVKGMIVRSYDPGNVVRDSAVSTFSSYTMSRDNYVIGVYMLGDDQPSIPAAVGKLNFSYKCR
ncbi:MAG: hypothetical protein IPL84_16600 [Chitinophagaceae bacterium]|nr:hypothetical protein [Chitinophagaceae bacterium]